MYSKFILQQTRLDNIDLQIIRLLSRDSRAPYKGIALEVGISSNAAKQRINKMVSNGVIQGFVLRINPVIFGYEKECILTLSHIGKTIKEQDVLKYVSLVGDVFVFARQLGGALTFVLSVRAGAEEKLSTLTDLLTPSTIRSIFLSYSPINTRIHSSDLEVMKYLLSNSRMQIDDIAKESSLSSKTVKRRLEVMKENHILQFSVATNLSSMQLTGYVEFIVLINIDMYHHKEILERIYREMQEYLLIIPNRYQKELIFAVFFCANIPTVNSILTRLESYEGVKEVEHFITINRVYYQDWLKREVDKRISQKDSLVSSFSMTSKNL
jgi:DNA-binding Lrp family transcriptional regulator